MLPFGIDGKSFKFRRVRVIVPIGIQNRQKWNGRVSQRQRSFVKLRFPKSRFLASKFYGPASPLHSSFLRFVPISRLDAIPREYIGINTLVIRGIPRYIVFELIYRLQLRNGIYWEQKILRRQIKFGFADEGWYYATRQTRTL